MVLSCGQQTQVAHGQGQAESCIQTVLRCLSQSWGPKELGLEGVREVMESEVRVTEPGAGRTEQPHGPLLATLEGSQWGFRGRGWGPGRSGRALQGCPEVVGLLTCPREVFAFVTAGVRLPRHPA